MEVFILYEKVGIFENSGFKKYFFALSKKKNDMNMRRKKLAKRIFFLPFFLVSLISIIMEYFDIHIPNFSLKSPVSVKCGLSDNPKIKSWKKINLDMDLYSLPKKFLNDLREALRYSPCVDTNKRRVIITLFSEEHKYLAGNLVCSMAHIKNFQKHYHILISCDEESYEYMQNLRNELESMNYVMLPEQIIRLNVDSRQFTYEQYCKMKIIIQYQLLLWDVETVVLDSDIVLFKDIEPIFEEKCDLTFASESCCDFNFDKNFNYTFFNVGFNRVIPNRETALIFNQWLYRAIPDPDLDQTVLQNFLSPHRITTNSIGKDIQLYQFKEFERLITIKFIHPLDFRNGGMLNLRFHETIREARRQNKQIPYGLHLAWINEPNKELTLDMHDLWFLDRNNDRCFSEPPKDSHFIYPSRDEDEDNEDDEDDNDNNGKM